MERLQLEKVSKVILSFIADHGGAVKPNHIKRFLVENARIEQEVRGTRQNRERAIATCLKYLTNKKRLHALENGMVAHSANIEPNKGSTAALSVLYELFDRVEEYSLADYPAQIGFISKAGDFFEIIYVRQGNEASVQADINVRAQREALQKASKRGPLPKRIIVLESMQQADDIDIPGMVRFAYVKKSGKVVMFNRKAEE